MGEINNPYRRSKGAIDLDELEIEEEDEEDLREARSIGKTFFREQCTANVAIAAVGFGLVLFCAIFLFDIKQGITRTIDALPIFEPDVRKPSSIELKNMGASIAEIRAAREQETAEEEGWFCPKGRSCARYSKRYQSLR